MVALPPSGDRRVSIYAKIRLTGVFTISASHGFLAFPAETTDSCPLTQGEFLWKTKRKSCRFLPHVHFYSCS